MPGIPAEAFEFYEALSAHNNREFFAQRRDDYERNVRGPLIEMGRELEPQFGSPRMFRPYRDVRFSKDKSPIKDHQGMTVDLRNGVGWYVQVSATGLMVAGGWYASTPQQVARFREAVVADPAGAELERCVAVAERHGLELGGDRLKTQPRGYAADHPRIELLRHRSLYVMRTWEPAAWMGTKRVVTRVRDSWQAARPLLEWLADHVGPPGEQR